MFLIHVELVSFDIGPMIFFFILLISIKSEIVFLVFTKCINLGFSLCLNILL